MNERIKELMGKTLDSEFSHTWDTMTYEGLLQFSEKFAELIVRECIQTIQMGITRDGHNTEQYLRSVKHIKQIREHFGV